MTTSVRLKTCLYSFTSPGGPMYPTRAVRHAAWDALDFLYPVSFVSLGITFWLNRRSILQNDVLVDLHMFCSRSSSSYIEI